MMEEFVKKMGFNSLEEFNKLVSSADLSTPEKIQAFTTWKLNDGTKSGLIKLQGEQK